MCIRDSCWASCPFTAAECWAKGHAGPPDEHGSRCHGHPDLMGRGGCLLACRGQPAHGRRAPMCRFKDAGGLVAAIHILAALGVDGVLPRRHAPPFPSWSGPSGHKRQHHVSLRCGPLLSCPVVLILNGNPCSFKNDLVTSDQRYYKPFKSHH